MSRTTGATPHNKMTYFQLELNACTLLSKDSERERERQTKFLHIIANVRCVDFTKRAYIMMYVMRSTSLQHMDIYTQISYTYFAFWISLTLHLDKSATISG